MRLFIALPRVGVSARPFIALPSVEELREQRKFAESRPRRFQEDDELYKEKANNQNEFARKFATAITFLIL